MCENSQCVKCNRVCTEVAHRLFTFAIETNFDSLMIISAQMKENAKLYNAPKYYYNVYDDCRLVFSWGFQTKELAESRKRQLEEMAAREGVTIRTISKIEEAVAYMVDEMVFPKWIDALLHYWSIDCKGHIDGVFAL